MHTIYKDICGKILISLILMVFIGSIISNQGKNKDFKEEYAKKSSNDYALNHN